jgi:DNA-binding CsgD family transcriptional regulator
LLVGAAASAHHRGDARTVRAAAEALDGLAERNPGVASVNGAKLLVDALTTGDFEPALEFLRSTPRLLLAARANEEYGRFVVGEGDRQIGLASLDAAYDQYTELGAAVPALRVQRVLQAAGARRRRWAPIPQRPEQGWDALTRMERQVALLIADGHSNRSAADELFLSPSTISTHLRAVFRKLDVHSRVQLAHVVLQKNDPSAH